MYDILIFGCENYRIEQDLVFSVKLQFGKTNLHFKKIFGPEIFGPKPNICSNTKFWVQTILGLKNFGFKKIRVQKNLGSISFRSKKIKVLKNFKFRILFSPTKIWIHRNFGSKRSFWVWKIFGSIMFWDG